MSRRDGPTTRIKLLFAMPLLAALLLPGLAAQALELKVTDDATTLYKALFSGDGLAV